MHIEGFQRFSTKAAILRIYNILSWDVAARNLLVELGTRITGKNGNAITGRFDGRIDLEYQKNRYSDICDYRKDV